MNRQFKHTWPLVRLTSRAFPSMAPVIANVLSLFTATVTTGSLWKRASSPERRTSDAADLGSQTMNEVSSETVTIFLPSGVNLPEVTGAAWPLKMFINLPLGTMIIHEINKMVHTHVLHDTYSPTSKWLNPMHQLIRYCPWDANQSTTIPISNPILI